MAANGSFRHYKLLGSKGQIIKVHVSVGYNMKAQNLLSFFKFYGSDGCWTVPMMPLTPINWLFVIIGWGNFNFSGSVFSIYLNWNFTVAVGGIQQTNFIGSRFFNFYSVINPFCWNGPANIKVSNASGYFIKRIIINIIRFGIRNINSLVYSEFIQWISVYRI